MTGFLAAPGYHLYSRHWHGYLQFVPYDGAIAWAGPAAIEHAHVFSYQDATTVLLDLPQTWHVILVPAEGQPKPIPANAQIPKPKGAAA